jgi:hypothetical protein
VELFNDRYQKDRKCIARPERHGYGQKRDRDNDPGIIPLTL